MCGFSLAVTLFVVRMSSGSGGGSVPLCDYWAALICACVCVCVCVCVSTLLAAEHQPSSQCLALLLAQSESVNVCCSKPVSVITDIHSIGLSFSGGPGGLYPMVACFDFVSAAQAMCS